MAKSKDLKSRLKASDRRRRRRPTPAAPPGTRQTPTTDVTGLLVDVILAEDDGVADATVIAALRGCKHGSPPQRADALRLFSQFQKIADRRDVDQRGFRSAIDGLLDLSAQHDPSGDRGENRFVNYLALLAT